MVPGGRGCVSMKGRMNVGVRGGGGGQGEGRGGSVEGMGGRGRVGGVD